MKGHTAATAIGMVNEGKERLSEDQNQGHRTPPGAESDGMLRRTKGSMDRPGRPVKALARVRIPKVDGRAAPFLYCGECEFLGWDGDRPIKLP